MRNKPWNLVTYVAAGVTIVMVAGCSSPNAGVTSKEPHAKAGSATQSSTAAPSDAQEGQLSAECERIGSLLTLGLDLDWELNAGEIDRATYDDRESSIIQDWQEFANKSDSLIAGSLTDAANAAEAGDLPANDEYWKEIESLQATCTSEGTPFTTNPLNGG